MADRDDKGKFVKGNSQGGARPGSGRKPLIQRELIDRAVSELDWLLIYSKLRDQALDGDVKAAEFLDIRRFGKPKETVELQGEDTGPIQVTIKAPPTG